MNTLLIIALATVTDCSSNCNQPEANLERIECRTHFTNIYTKCIINCPTDDVACSSACSRELDENLLKRGFRFFISRSLSLKKP